MDVIFVEKTPNQQLLLGHKDSNYYAQEPFVSPRNRYSTGANQTPSRSIPSSKLSRVPAHLLPLQSIVNNIGTPKRGVNQHSNSNLLLANPIQTPTSNVTTEKGDNQHHIRVFKNQPRISNNNHLPSVFATEKSQAIKIKKLVTKQKMDKYGELSIDQECVLTEPAALPSPNHRDRSSKSFLSPVRMMMSPALNLMSNNGSVNVVVNRLSGNIKHISSRNENQPHPVTRESSRRAALHSANSIREDESSINVYGNNAGGANSGNDAGCTTTTNKKRIIVFKRFLSKSPDNKMPVTVEDSNKNTGFDSAAKLFEQLSLPVTKAKSKITLSEMITLRKVQTTQNSGILKRMLHAPSLNIYDIQEEPIKAHENMKEWISQWRKNFHRKDNRNLLKIFTCFWNSPEGHVSVLMEATKKGSLQDLLDHHVSLPENCIQQVANSLVQGVNEVHMLMKKPHGAIRLNEVLFDSYYQPKLGPGISHQANIKHTSPHCGSHQRDSDDSLYRCNIPNGIVNKISSANEFRSMSPSQQKTYTTSSNNSNGSNGNTNHHISQFSADVFDLGYLLLTCALGNLEFYDSTSFYTLENLKYILDLLPNHRRYNRSQCCILHSEEDLRKFHSGLSSTTKLRDPSRKGPLNNNYQLRSPRDAVSSNNNKRSTSPFTLLELLQEQGRYSDSFVDFLCCCLRLDPSARLEPWSLMDHEFLSSTHVSLGPLISLNELLNTTKKEQEQGQQINSFEKLNEIHLDRVCEAIKIVLMNQEAKDKFTRFANNRDYDNPYTREHFKLQELASELGIPVEKVVEKFREEIFNSEFTY